MQPLLIHSVQFCHILKSLIRSYMLHCSLVLATEESFQRSKKEGGSGSPGLSTVKAAYIDYLCQPPGRLAPGQVTFRSQIKDQFHIDKAHFLQWQKRVICGFQGIC